MVCLGVGKIKRADVHVVRVAGIGMYFCLFQMVVSCLHESTKCPEMFSHQRTPFFPPHNLFIWNLSFKVENGRSLENILFVCRFMFLEFAHKHLNNKMEETNKKIIFATM